MTRTSHMHADATLAPRRRRWWPVIRKVWVTVGSLAGVTFFVWFFLASRATPDARAALKSDDRVAVTHGAGFWHFAPAGGVLPGRVGLVFFPGAMIEPAAYAPLARAVADVGHPVVLVELPRRGAFGGAEKPEVIERARAGVATTPTTTRWFVAGHSRGAVVASRFALQPPIPVAGLILIGTTHPRDFSLSHLTIPVTKILGTRDAVADLEKSEANRHLLPASTRWILLEGGNHSQFGWYGFQPGDRTATLGRAAQQAATIAAVREALR